MNNVAKSFDDQLERPNYFNSPTKLFSNVSISKFLAKPFFPCIVSTIVFFDKNDEIHAYVS